MSNETSSVNRPPHNFSHSGRYRKFSCITYLNEMQLKVCLLKHMNQIRAYAYAYHDKDVKEDGGLKEPHCHLIIITYNACTLSAVRRWFDGYVQNGKDVTTTAQKCTDEFEVYKYLTHSTVQARAEGKYQYDDGIIQSYNPDYFKADEKSAYDNILLAAEMLLSGKSVHDCGKIFGRDFILHYRQIKEYLSDVLQWEKNNYEINSFSELLTKQAIIAIEKDDKRS